MSGTVLGTGNSVTLWSLHSDGEDKEILFKHKKCHMMYKYVYKSAP